MWYPNRLLLATLGALVAMTLCASSPASPPESDYEAIEGRWVVVSFTQAGREVEGLVDDTVIFADGRSVYRGKREVKRARYQIDPTASPPTFDLLLTDEEGHTNACKGIYKIEGDTLTVCHGRPTDPRPADFTSDESNRAVLVVLQRHVGDEPE